MGSYTSNMYPRYILFLRFSFQLLFNIVLLSTHFFFISELFYSYFLHNLTAKKYELKPADS